MERQFTLKKPFSLEGIGIHTGSKSRVVVEPADENTGYLFDVGGVLIEASPENVISTERAVVLAQGGVKVFTVEHLLSALYALGVDNAYIRVYGEEIPILDGSAYPFARAIYEVGIKKQKEYRKYLEVSEPGYVAANGGFIAFFPSKSFTVDVMIDFPHPRLKEQEIVAEFTRPSMRYLDEIAPARTFGFLYELELLKKKGLSGGVSFSNVLVFDEEGPLNPPRFPNEPVRHKVVDFIGDVSLLGKRLRAHVVAYKPGHSLDVAFVRALKEKRYVSFASEEVLVPLRPLELAKIIFS